MKLAYDTFEQLEFGDGCYINLTLAKNNELSNPHWHREAEIIMPIEGSYQVNVNGIEYSPNAYDLLFISPGELHGILIPSEGCHMVLQFSYSLINNLKDFNLLISILQSIKLITREADPDIHQEILNLMLDIKKEHAEGNEFLNALMYADLLRIYVLIARKYSKISVRFPKMPQTKQQEYMLKFTTIFTYINNNYTEDISQESIAKLAGFSKFHFSRLFKQWTNMSLNEYINLKRIAEAEVLLLNQNLSITEVSLQSGFNCLSSFNRAFKLSKNCNPTEFKKLYCFHYSNNDSPKTK
ncbi:MAG: AraC family transcriptional regulator [Mobilitalea sp.]